MKPVALKADEWRAPGVGCSREAEDQELCPYILPAPAAPWGTFAESHSELIVGQTEAQSEEIAQTQSCD